MDAQELRNLQEAYMEVYEERDTLHPLWETKRQDKKAQKERNELISAKQKRKEDRERNRNPLFGPSEKMTKTQREETDLYDIILSHLLDEGYADTQQAAEVMMVNMSEDWRNSIVEERKPLPVGKMDAKAKELKSKFLKTKPGSSEAKNLISRASQITGTRDKQTV